MAVTPRRGHNHEEKKDGVDGDRANCGGGGPNGVGGKLFFIIKGTFRSLFFFLKFFGLLFFFFLIKNNTNTPNN
ncbi:hypothetical protein, partial [Salmonella enterica]|uniref:hypothetical protein n=1 Tax=Salmonella enterica TaxID=28901 RepID=UPI00067616BD